MEGGFGPNGPTRRRALSWVAVLTPTLAWATPAQVAALAPTSRGLLMGADVDSPKRAPAIRPRDRSIAEYLEDRLGVGPNEVRTLESGLR